MEALAQRVRSRQAEEDHLIPAEEVHVNSIFNHLREQIQEIIIQSDKKAFNLVDANNDPTPPFIDQCVTLIAKLVEEPKLRRMILKKVLSWVILEFKYPRSEGNCDFSTLLFNSHPFHYI